MPKNKNQQSIVGKDSFCRMNFLYQASMLMAGTNNTLSSHYGKQCRTIGKKTVLRCDPEIKRNLCKKCNVALQPGITAEVDITAQIPSKKRKRRKRKKKNNNIDENSKVFLECQQCGFQRSFQVNSNYGFWLETPASIAEELTLAPIESTENKQTQKEPHTNQVN